MCMDDVITFPLIETPRCMEAIADVMQSHRHHLQTKEVVLKREKSQMPLPGDFGPESLPQDH